MGKFSIITRCTAMFVGMLLGAFSGCSRPHEISDVQRWFAANQKTLDDLTSMLADTTAIQRVEPSTRPELIVENSTFNPSEKRIYDEACVIAKALHVISIDVARTGGKPDGKLLCVTYLLYSRGIVTSGGEYVAVAFVPSPALIPMLSRGDTTYIRLSSNFPWYVVYYKG